MRIDGLVELEDRRVPAATGAAEPGVRDPLQELTAAVARDPRSWDDAAERDVRRRFDARARDWSTRDSPEYRFPLTDALERGGVPRGGLCLEIGSGTGIQTPTLLAHFDSVLALDLSLEMLTRAPRGRAIPFQADASCLPLKDHCASSVVCVNAFLFPAQYARALRPGGAVVFVSTRGEHTPIYLAPDAVLESLRRTEGSFTALTAHAGQGSWTVARRS